MSKIFGNIRISGTDLLWINWEIIRLVVLTISE